MNEGCKSCGVSVCIAPAEVERLLREYLAAHPSEKTVSAAEHQRRLAICATCPDLQYGTTCRHCGCLVAVRAKLAGKECPARKGRWG